MGNNITLKERVKLGYEECWDIKRKRLEWLRHLIGIDKNGMVKKLFYMKMEEKRTVERLEGVKKSENSKVKRWRQKATNRRERASVVRA